MILYHGLRSVKAQLIRQLPVESRLQGGITVAKIGRNAGNGRFTTVKKARDNPKTHVVETIKKGK